MSRPQGVFTSGKSLTRRHGQSSRAYDTRFVGYLLFENGNIAAEQSAGSAPDLLAERNQQVGSCIRDVSTDDHHFGIEDDDPRVNKSGGAIAIGHPLGATGVRLMIQLARQFEEHPEVRYGATAMCVGLGQGGTVIWENPNFDKRAARKA